MSNTVEMTLSLKDTSKEVLEQLAKHFNKTTKEMEEELKRVSQAFKEFEQMAKNTNLFQRIQKDAEIYLKKAENRFKSMKSTAKQSFETIHRIARTTFMAIATFTGFATKSYADFEYSIKKIQTISKDSYDTISTSVRKMAYETGISSGEISTALYDIVQVIQDVPEKYKMLDTVNKLSIAGFTDTTQATNLLTSAMLNYNLSVEDTVELSNKLIVAQNRGNTTIGSMATNLGKMLPMAKMANVSLEEVLASVSTMTLGGIRTEQATTFLRSFLNEVAKTDSEVGKLFTKLNGGIDFKNFMLAGGEMIDALIILEKEAEKGNKTLSDLFGNVRSSMGAGSLAGLKETYASIFKDITNAPVDQLQKAFEKMESTTKMSINKLKETFNQFKQEIGERFAEDMGNILGMTNTTSFDEMFNQEKIDKIYAYGKAIVVVTGAIIGLKLAMIAYKAVADTINIGSFVLGLAKAHPILAGIAATVGTITYLYKSIKSQDTKNKEDLEKAKEENSTLERKKELLQAIKSDLEKGIINPGILEVSKDYDELKSKMEEARVLMEEAPNTEESKNRIKELIEEVQNLFDELNGLDGKKVNIYLEIKERNLNNKNFTKTIQEFENDNMAIQQHSLNTARENAKVVNDFVQNRLVAMSDLADGIGILEKNNYTGKELVEMKEKLSKLGKESLVNKSAKKSSSDPFKEFISEIGAKIKFDLNIEDKIEALEQAKNRFKDKVGEINIAITNLRMDLLKSKIEKALEGVTLESHKYSSDEQKAKLEEAKKYTLQALELEKTKAKINKETIADLENKLENINFNEILMPMKKELENITSNLESVKKVDEKSTKEVRDKAIGTLESLKPKLESLLKEAQEKYESGNFTQGDFENFTNELEKVRKGIEEAGDGIKKNGLDFSASVNALANGLSALGTATGSKTISGLGSILGNVVNIGSALKGFGGLSSITGMFSGANGALAGGLASLGSVAGAVAGGVGLAVSIGSMFGRSGKKKKAKIEANNQNELKKYDEQTKAMQALTEALKKNTENVKTISEKILTDIAKNPTLSSISKGNKNFDLFKNAMIEGKRFADISAVEIGSAKYRSGFRKKRKKTYTNVNVSEDKLLKYLGFDKTELDLFTDDEMRQLNKALVNVKHDDLVKATGRNLDKSNIEEWKNQISEFVKQIDILDKENADLFRASTLESFVGVEFKSEKDLIKEYTAYFKELGLEGEQYNETIKEMAKNQQVLVTAMQDVRANTIDGLANGNGGFMTSIKGYFENIFKNASSIAYDVAFSDVDSYMYDMYKKISERLVEIKKNGKLDFSNLFAGFDFSQLKIAEANEIQAKKSLDVIKQQLLNSGIDLSIVNKILPQSDFNNRINDLKNALSNAMNTGLTDKSFFSFTKTLGESLYNSMKSSLVKAFSESSLYQGLISKFIKAEDFQAKLEAAGNFKEAFKISEEIMKKFGYELEASGFGGFDSINNLAKEDTKLGNAYYQDKASNVDITVNNNFYAEVYGVEDLDNRILSGVQTGIKKWINKPNGSK